MYKNQKDKEQIHINDGENQFVIKRNSSKVSTLKILGYLLIFLVFCLPGFMAWIMFLMGDIEAHLSKFFIPGMILLSLICIWAINRAYKEAHKDLDTAFNKLSLQGAETLVDWTYPFSFWQSFAQQEYKRLKKNGWILYAVLGSLSILLLLLFIYKIEVAIIVTWMFSLFFFGLVGMVRQGENKVKQAFLGNQKPSVQISQDGILISKLFIIPFNSSNLTLKNIVEEEKHGIPCLGFYADLYVPPTHQTAGYNVPKEYYIPIPKNKEEEAKHLMEKLNRYID